MGMQTQNEWVYSSTSNGVWPRDQVHCTAWAELRLLQLDDFLLALCATASRYPELPSGAFSIPGLTRRFENQDDADYRRHLFVN